MASIFGASVQSSVRALPLILLIVLSSSQQNLYYLTFKSADNQKAQENLKSPSIQICFSYNYAPVKISVVQQLLGNDNHVLEVTSRTEEGQSGFLNAKPEKTFLIQIKKGKKQTKVKPFGNKTSIFLMSWSFTVLFLSVNEVPYKIPTQKFHSADSERSHGASQSQ